MNIVNHQQLPSWPHIGHGHDLREGVGSELTDLVGLLLEVVLADVMHGRLDGSEDLEVSAKEPKGEIGERDRAEEKGAYFASFRFMYFSFEYSVFSSKAECSSTCFAMIS